MLLLQEVLGRSIEAKTQIVEATVEEAVASGVLTRHLEPYIPPTAPRSDGEDR